MERKEKQNLLNRRALGDRENVPMDVDEPQLEVLKSKNRKYVINLFFPSFPDEMIPEGPHRKQIRSSGRETSSSASQHPLPFRALLRAPFIPTCTIHTLSADCTHSTEMPFTFMTTHQVNVFGAVRLRARQPE